MPGFRKRTVVVSLTAGLSLLASGCAGWGGGPGGGGPDSINVLMVNNPQMVDLQKLTADHFTKQTGIRVNYTVLPENDVRDKISQEFSSQAGQYDVASLSNFEIPIYAGSKWIAPLNGYLAKDRQFDQADILKPMTTSLSKDGKVYGEPFYGESSFLMYRKDVLAKKGITMPARPTWPQVAAIAAKVDQAQPGMAGICLRGQPGWGQVFAPLTTVVNTFGGTWFTKDWHAAVAAPGFVRATNFYVGSGARARREGRPAGRVHRVPEQPRPGQGRDVVRRDVRCGLAGGPGLAGARQDRLRAGPGGADEALRLALRLVVEHPAGQPEEGQRLEVHLVGVRQAVRGPRRLDARLVTRAGRQARLDVQEPFIPQGGQGLRRTDPRGDRHSRPGEPGRATPPGDRHPVRRHPRVPRHRHPDLPGRQLRDRGADDRRTRPSTKGQGIANDVAERYRSMQAGQ